MADRPIKGWGEVMKLEHDYTVETLAKAVELWGRLINAYGVSLNEQPNGSYVEAETIDREWLTSLVISDGEEVELPGKRVWPAVEVTLISYSDYGGSDLDAANVEALRDTPGVVVSTGGVHGEGEASMVLGELPTNGEGLETGIEWLRHVVEIIEGLTDYPLLNDEIHSEYIENLAQEAWSQYLSMDVQRELRELLDDDNDDALDNASDDAIREAFYGYQHPSGESWTADGATSVVHLYHLDAVKHVARRVFGRDVDVECECAGCYLAHAGRHA